MRSLIGSWKQSFRNEYLMYNEYVPDAPQRTRHL